MKNCLLKLNAELRDFDTAEVTRAADAYLSRGKADKDANVAAIEDHLRDLRQQRARIEGQVLDAWKERDPQGYEAANGDKSPRMQGSLVDKSPDVQGSPPPLELKGETEAEIREREAAQAREAEEQRKKDAAPPADSFTLTGSNRDVDEARARGQMELAPSATEAAKSDRVTALFNTGVTAGEALSVDEVQAIVKRLGLSAKIADTEADLPAYLRAQIREEGAEGQVRGVFDPRTGRVWLVRTNIKSEAEGIFVALHESAHRGLVKVFGPDLRSMLERMYYTNKNLRREADALRTEHGYDVVRATEEVVANMALRGQARDLKGWQAFVELIRKWLAERGFNIKVTDAMAEFIAGAAAQAGKSELHVFAGEDAGRFHLAYHGSPHDFERFDISKIGSGEGAQVFGYGLYFAGRKEVAEYYRDKLSRGGPLQFTKGDRTISSYQDIAAEVFQPGRVISGFGGLDRVIEFKREGDYRWAVKVESVDAAGRVIEKRPRWHSTFPDNDTVKRVLARDGWKDKKAGKLYEVELAPKEDEYLDWDKPLSRQSAIVKQRIKALLDEIDPSRWGEDQDPTGEQFYHELGWGKVHRDMGGDRAASDLLQRAGVPGIKFLDNASRNAGEGTHNFVVFDDKHVSVKAKFSRTGKENLDRLKLSEQLVGDMVDRVKAGTQQPDKPVTITRVMPNALQAVGVPNLPLVLPGNVALKSVGRDPELEKHRWTLGDPAMLKRIVEDLFEPVMIFKSATQPDSVVVLTREVDSQGQPVIVSIRKRGMVGRDQVAVITSAYPRQEAQRAFEGWAEQGLLLYYDREKVQKWKTAAPSSTVRLDLPWVVQKGATAGHILLSDETVIQRNGAMFSRAADLPGMPPQAAPPRPPQRPQLPLDGGVAGNRATWDAPEPTKLDDFVYSLQNKHVDTKKVVKAIKDAGREIADRWNPYLQEELYHGRTAKLTQDFAEKELRPLLTDMAARGVQMQELEKYLHARHAQERNEQIARVNPDMPDGGSGMTTAEAREYLDGIDETKRLSMEALAARIDRITKGTRELIIGYGLESPETIKAWEDTYQHYVPLMREDADHGGGMGTGQGFSIKGSASKRATGSSRTVVDILANVAMQRERAITRGEKNRVALALYGLAKLNSNPGFWKVDQPPTIRGVNERTGLVEDRVDPLYKSRDNVVTARVYNPKTGKVQELAVIFEESNERAMRMAHAVKNLDADQLGQVLAASARVTRYFASINTQYNPVFGIVNLTRDVQSAILNLSTTPLRGKKAEVLQNTVSALRGIYIDLRDTRAGETPTSSWAQLWEEFQREGGQTGYRDMFATSKARAEALEDELKRITEGKAKQAGRAVFDWLSDYNAAGENAVRLAAYKVAKDQGMTAQQAASLAKNLTVNFNRKGQAALQAGALYAFFNASAQGTARMMQTLTGPAAKKIVTGGLILGAMQALALAAAGFDEDEPPQFVRENSLILPIGGKKYVSIPMPQGFKLIPNVSRIATEFVLGGFKGPGKRAAQLIGVFAETFNPLGSAGLSLQTIAPTVVDPFAALAENKDWTGRPIAKDDRNPLAPTPGPTRAKDTASWWGRQISEAVNLMSGGTKYTPGALSPTPDQIDYLIGQATGGLGRELSKTAQTVESTITGDDLPTYKIPLVGRLYGNAEGQAEVANKFYANVKAINEHEGEVKGRLKDRQPVAEYIRENPEARLVQLAITTERQVSKLRAKKREAVENDRDRAYVKLLEDQITAAMKRFNDRVDQLRTEGAAR